MTSANEALLRRLYDAQSRGDLEAYLDILSDDFVMHIPGHSQIAGDYVGKEEMRRHFREITDLSGGTFRTRVHDLMASGDHGVGLIEVTVEREGTAYELPRIHVWHIRDGELTALWLHPLDQAAFDDYWG